jgi:tRNA(fMet)-specific endonuclease VapC
MVIDTGIFIDHLRKSDKRKSAHYKLSDSLPLFISSISYFELTSSATSQQKMDDLKLLLGGIIILHFDQEQAEIASALFLKLKRSNQLIDFKDIFIAATCISIKIPIATFNRTHFERMPNLILVELPN